MKETDFVFGSPAAEFTKSSSENSKSTYRTSFWEEDYSDIINLPHYEPRHHPRMPLYDRAAQFAPFAALSGHADAISETARWTDKQIELSTDMTDELDRRFTELLNCIAEHPSVTVIYFLPDEKKHGGSYRVQSGILSGFHEQKKVIVFQDGTEISLADVVSLEGDFYGA